MHLLIDAPPTYGVLRRHAPSRQRQVGSLPSPQRTPATSTATALGLDTAHASVSSDS